MLAREGRKGRGGGAGAAGGGANHDDAEAAAAAGQKAALTLDLPDGHLFRLGHRGCRYGCSKVCNWAAHFVSTSSFFAAMVEGEGNPERGARSGHQPFGETLGMWNERRGMRAAVLSCLDEG